jgi:hypothetical protein
MPDDLAGMDAEVKRRIDKQSDKRVRIAKELSQLLKLPESSELVWAIVNTLRIF